MSLFVFPFLVPIPFVFFNVCTCGGLRSFFFFFSEPSPSSQPTRLIAAPAAALWAQHRACTLNVCRPPRTTSVGTFSPMRRPWRPRESSRLHALERTLTVMDVAPRWEQSAASVSRVSAAADVRRSYDHRVATGCTPHRRKRHKQCSLQVALDGGQAYSLVQADGSDAAAAGG